MEKIVIAGVVGIIIGAIIMDAVNKNFAKVHGYPKRGGIFENIPK